MRNYVILSSKPEHVSKYKFKQHTYSYSNVSIFLNPADKKQKIKVLINGTDVTTFNFVYFRTWRKYENIATPIALCLKSLKIPFIDSEVARNLLDSKSFEYVTFIQNNLPIPRTVIAHAVQLTSLEHELMSFLTYPFILKLSEAKQGLDNYLVRSHKELCEILTSYSDDQLFIAQEFIPNVSDYRLVMTNYALSYAYQRIRSADSPSHLNNISQGAKRRRVANITAIHELTLLAAKASKLLHREICGVDIIIDAKTQKPYLLEANSSPQLTYLPVLKKVKAFLSTYE